jgi:hypothetical protein
MQPDQGGDGVAMAGTGEQPIGNVPPIQGDRSETAEELNLKIEQELGLPHTEVKTDETADNGQDNGADSTDGTNVDGDDGSGADEANGDEADVSGADESADGQAGETIAAEPVAEDLFIEVEDAEGVTHKISKIDDLPEDFSPKNNRQIIEIVAQLTKLDQQMNDRERTRAQEALLAEQTRVQQEQFDAWDKEIAELVKQKRVTASDTDTTNKVLEFMAKVNTDRAKAGNPNLIYSFEDALDKYEAVQAKEAANDKQKQENDRAKAKASLIGGSNSTGAGSSSVYVSGSARSMDDIVI